jgi:hypothetical protein
MSNILFLLLFELHGEVVSHPNYNQTYISLYLKNKQQLKQKC